MSLKQIVHNQDTKRLLDEGYEVEIRNGYLLVHSIPYVNSRQEVRFGVIATNLHINAGNIGRPDNHQVWFSGDFPCHHTGLPIEGIRHSSQTQILMEGLEVHHHFSNKPSGGYSDYYSKTISYINIISSEAKAIEPDITPRTYKVIPPIDDESVFKYHDSASSRADILAISMKLAMNKVGIIGLGGTGSYTLDLVAKTPAKEIHLFDGDLYLQHNAFRSPGAASQDDFDNQMLKVDYFSAIYLKMRDGIFAHTDYITNENISKIQNMNFIFLCVDKGPVRKLISNYLISNNIPFVDVGMDLMVNPEQGNIFGTCRVTMSTPEKSDHFSAHAPISDIAEDDLYRKNIQVADMNALNAAIAVLKWKQYCEFYTDFLEVHHTTYSIDSHSLTRDEMTGVETETDEE